MHKISKRTQFTFSQIYLKSLQTSKLSDFWTMLGLEEFLYIFCYQLLALKKNRKESYASLPLRKLAKC